MTRLSEALTHIGKTTAMSIPRLASALPSRVVVRATHLALQRR
jgi:hypothetical protein